MRKAAVAVYVLVLVLFGWFIAKPYLRAQHDTPTETPSPQPISSTALDVVPGGQRLCMAGVAMTKQSQRMRFTIGTYHKPGPPLVVSVKAPGYAITTRVRAGWPDNLTHNIAVPTPKRDQAVTVCIRNAGRRDIALYAAGDAAQSRVAVSLQGKPVGPTPSLAFFESHTQSIADNASLTAQRITVFRGFLGHTWVVWTLAVLFAIGMPILMGIALWRAADEP